MRPAAFGDGESLGGKILKKGEAPAAEATAEHLTLTLVCPGACTLQGFQKHDQLLLLRRSQGAKLGPDFASLAAMPANGIFQRQRTEVVHKSRLRTETPEGSGPWWEIRRESFCFASQCRTPAWMRIFRSELLIVGLIPGRCDFDHGVRSSMGMAAYDSGRGSPENRQSEQTGNNPRVRSDSFDDPRF